jgi:hypothetical protein
MRRLWKVRVMKRAWRWLAAATILGYCSDRGLGYVNSTLGVGVAMWSRRRGQYG